MNFLINLYLSDNKKEKIISNFLLQVIRRHDTGKYSADIIESMEYYRNILNYTEAHPSFQKSLTRLNPKMRRKGNMLIHIFYDHFLALNWENFSAIPLEKFISRTHKIIIDNQEILPYKINHALPELLTSPNLKQINTFGGLHNYLKDLTRIIKVNTINEGAINDLMQNYPEFTEDFNQFFFDLIRYARAEKTRSVQYERIVA